MDHPQSPSRAGIDAPAHEPEAGYVWSAWSAASQDGATVRMRDVAARAGVSLATVSLVLHERPGARISDLTRERVVRAAADLGYVVRPGRRRRRGAVTPVLGLVCHELSGPDLALARSFTLAAAHRGAVPVVVTCAGDPLAIQQAVSTLGAITDGMGISASLNGAVRAVRGVPKGAIFLGGPSPLSGHEAGLADDHDAVRAAMEELTAHGHRWVAVISVQGTRSWSWRQDTARREALERGLDVHHLRVAASGQARDPALVRLLTVPRPERPSALLCASGEALRSVLTACRALSLTVPADLSVVAHDDGTHTHLLEDQRITSVQAPHRELADWAVDRLLAQHVGRAPDTLEAHPIPCLLVRRHSVSRVPSVGDVHSPWPSGARDR